MYPTLTWPWLLSVMTVDDTGPSTIRKLSSGVPPPFLVAAVTLRQTAGQRPAGPRVADFTTEFYQGSQGLNCARVDPGGTHCTALLTRRAPITVPPAVLPPFDIVTRHSSAVSSSTFTCGFTVLFFACWRLSHASHG